MLVLIAQINILIIAIPIFWHDEFLLGQQTNNDEEQINCRINGEEDHLSILNGIQTNTRKQSDKLLVRCSRKQPSSRRRLKWSQVLLANK